MPRYDFAPTRRRRSPLPVILLLILVGLVGLLVYAGMRDNEVALTNMEQDVTNELAR
jgi:hypothetical protein